MPDSATSLDAPAGRPNRRSNRGSKLLRYVLVVVVLALVAMWVYAFVFAPRSGVNPVKDPAWTEGARAACVAAGEQLEPLVFRTHIDESNKATELPKYVAGLDQATVILDGMLDSIEALPRTSEKAQKIVPLWLADYRAYVQDLRDWTNQLRAGDIVQLAVTKTDTNIPVDERINTFARENRITECETTALST